MAYKTVPKYSTKFKYRQKRLPDVDNCCILYNPNFRMKNIAITPTR